MCAVAGGVSGFDNLFDFAPLPPSFVRTSVRVAGFGCVAAVAGFWVWFGVIVLFWGFVACSGRLVAFLCGRTYLERSAFGLCGLISEWFGGGLLGV
jgi:hypothetical protein